MSSDNLDDFFKKRDKKKKGASSKSKFQKLDTEEFAKQLEAAVVIEDTDAAVVDASSAVASIPEPVLAPSAAPVEVAAAPVHVPAQSSTNSHSNQSSGKQHLDNFDEDWKPFESEDNKDYTGLRVNILQNWKDDEYYEENEETEGSTDKKPSCPWSQRIAAASRQEHEGAGVKGTEEDEGDKNNNTKISSNEAAEEVKPATGGKYLPPHLRATQMTSTAAAPAPAPAAPTAYVPPALRKQQAAVSTGDSVGFQTQTRRTNRNQPNINDICEFPSLGDLNQSSASGSESTTTKTEK